MRKSFVYAKAAGEAAQPFAVVARPAEGFSGPATNAANYFAPIRARLAHLDSSVIQSFKVLCDSSQIRIGCDDLEVAAANSSEPPFAHLRYRLASDETAKLRTEATFSADDEGPEAFSDGGHIRSSTPGRHTRARRRKKRRRFWAE